MARAVKHYEEMRDNFTIRGSPSTKDSVLEEDDFEEEINEE